MYVDNINIQKNLKKILLEIPYKLKTKEELIRIIRRYVNDESLRESVADAGYLRVNVDGHDVVSRMKQVLEWVEQSKATKQE